MISTRVMASCALALLTASANGCGKPSSDLSVRGHASYRGEAIPGGVVTFYPAKGRPVSAVLSPSGDYEVELPPGDYGVVINIGVKLPAGWKEGDPMPDQKMSLPPEYTTRTKSRLTAAVVQDQREPIDFALE